MRLMANMDLNINIRGFFQRISEFIFGKKAEAPEQYNFLVVCTGNTCRSPMAMSILRFLKREGGDGDFVGNVESAGLAVTEHAAAKNAIEIAKDYGCDLTLHNPQQLNQAQVDWADFILTMDAGAAQKIRDRYDAKGKVLTMATFGVSSGAVMDPYGGSIEVYHKTAMQMEKLLRKGLDEMGEDKASRSQR
jgi:protein-tyrosine-phosphatase